MKRSILKKAEIFVIAAVMSLISVFGVFAETAKEVTKESGRNIIVQDVKLPDANSRASVQRGFQEFAPAAGVRLAGGDRVVTKGNAVIYLTVDTKIVLRLDGNSEAVIEKSILGQKLSVKLKKGGMFYNVASQTAENESLELMTNNVSIAIRGTSGYLVADNSRVTHMLFDGHIEVTDGKHTIAQKPGESFDTKMGPSGDMTENLYLDTFLLNEIPQSVVTEILADKALEKRILASLPAAVDENGAPVYADEASFEAKAKEPWTDSMAIGEVRNDPKEPEPDPAPAPAPEPEPDPKHICPVCGQEAEHEKRICLACKDAGKPESEYTYYACDTEKVTFHEEVGTCACGKHLVPACRKAEHEIVLEKCEICELVSYQCNPVDLTAHKEVECPVCHEKYCPVQEAAEPRHTAVCKECGETYCVSDEQEKQKHEDTHFTPECQKHKVPACQASKHKLEWKCEYCEKCSYVCEPLTSAEKAKHVLTKCEGCGTEYCLGDAEEGKKHALIRTCICGTKVYACSPETLKNAHIEVMCDECQEEYCPASEKRQPEHNVHCAGCGETYCSNCVTTEVRHEKKTLPCGCFDYDCLKKTEHALIMAECPHCHLSVYECYTTKDRHTEKRICEECKKAGKPESEYTYYACDHEAVAKHEAICEPCTGASKETVYYCSVTAEEEHVKVCGACSAGGSTVTFCPTYEKTHPLHMVYCPMENGGCGNFYCSIAESELHEIRECAACKAAGKQPSEYTYYACNGEAVAKHEATCTGGHRYCSISQSAEHVATCTSGHTYCPTSQGDAHVATCASCQTAGRAYIYCPTAEIDVPKHHAICSLADGGCGEVYCPISQISAHMNSGSNCKNKHSLKECILSDESPIFKLHFSFDKYECDCGRTILSCEALTDAHDAAYCTVCRNYHKKCLDCSGQPKSQNSAQGVDNSGSDANPLVGASQGSENSSAGSSPKSGENSTDGGTGSEGLSSDDADAPVPERMPYGEENVPEVAVECVAIVAAEASEKEDE